MIRKTLNPKHLLPSLHQQTRQILAESELDRLHWRVFDLVTKSIPLDAFYIGYCNKRNATLHVRFLVDGGKAYPGFTDSLENSIASHTIQKREAVVLNNSMEIAALLGSSELKSIGHQQRFPQSIISSPLVASGKAIGVISVQSYKAQTYSPEVAQLVQIISNEVAVPLLEAFNREVAGHPGFALNTASRAQNVEVVANDCTNLASQNEKLRSVINLARRICHEMNQPLTGISGYCALIREELDDGHHACEDLNQIELQAQRLEQLIYNFQSIAQLEDVEEDTESERHESSA